ncbi:MAG: ribosome silencing factor [Deltaproteobacteria bacterium]|nr:ribosome silencing factor [Deltaproteobacteria bacterium]MBW1953759.1 ribosome silencing factor [Deltaproteobacteria bacterium]MBW1986919.1 ribosome silencing factor [Deltaproteobacteria bacterium]MBW2134092.1 ribosome silencing factor [Deltaproteobacteria bacterium]
MGKPLKGIKATAGNKVQFCAQSLVEKKAQDLVILDVRSLSSFTDYFIICSGNSRRQVVALAQHLEEALRRLGEKPLGIEGLEEGQWVLLDYNDVIIHIFSQPMREFYDLENLWAEAPRQFLETGLTSETQSVGDYRA